MTTIRSRTRVLFALTLLLALSGCANDTASSGGNIESPSAETPETGSGDFECTDSAVDTAVCDDLNDAAAAADGGTAGCDLVDGSAVFTEAFREVSQLAARCLVPDETSLFDALAARGMFIDGVADLGTEGTVDSNVFYLASTPDGSCYGEPTYWPSTNSWSQYKSTSPLLTEERFATPSEALDAICARF